MAKMRPELNEENLRSLGSEAEVKVYRALRDEIPDDVLVIHSLTWTYKTRQGELVEGEAETVEPLLNKAILQRRLGDESDLAMAAIREKVDCSFD